MQLVDPLSINDRGEIAGIGVPAGCPILADAACGHAFVLIPCDDDHQNVEGATRLQNGRCGGRCDQYCPTAIPTGDSTNYGLTRANDQSLTELV